MRVIFLCPYPHAEAPSQRFRFEQYFKYLDEQDVDYQQYSFLTEEAWKHLYLPGHTIEKVFYIIQGFWRRWLHLFLSLSADYIFIHREASPVGPPIFEWLLAKVFRKKLIFDFDDAIWIAVISEENRMAAFAKNHSKFYKICKWSYKISAGNQYLADFAAQFNPLVVLNPTTIDTENLHQPNLYTRKVNEKLKLGWTGTHSTLTYLEEIAPILNQLASIHDFEIVVISNKEPSFSLLKMKFIKWDKSTEIEDLLSFDIGLMPLSEDAWSSGKCGFKALQYMALEIPAVASPVGVNSQIIEDGVNGFLAEDEVDWKQKLEILIKDEALRKALGEEGRKTVVNRFSVMSNKNNFLSLFE